MKKTAIKFSGVALALLLLSGCNNTKPELKIDKAGKEIHKSKSDYTNVLRRANNMIAVFYGKPMNIVVDTISNMTAEQARLPADITDIVKTAFNSIGSNVTVIYDNNSENLKQSEIFKINGSITKYDVIYSDSNGMDMEVTGTHHGQRGDAGGSRDNENQIIKLAINFNPSDLYKGNYIARTSTSNEVTIEKKSKAHEFAFSILGSGFGFNNSVTKSQGVHASIVVLVEFSVVEVLGKLGKFPYWLLVDGGKVNYDIVNYLLKNFLREPLNKKIQMISYLLALRGAEGVQPTRVMTPALKKAIIDYKVAHGMPANDTITKRLYKSLLEGK